MLDVSIQREFLRIPPQANIAETLMNRSCKALLALALLGMSPLGKAATTAESAFRFTDATTEVGLQPAFRGAFNHAIAWGDFDNDGRLDLFLGNFADRAPRFNMDRNPGNMLLRQTKARAFEPWPAPAVEIPARCSGAVLADLDNDGDLDLYVSSNTKVKLMGDDRRKQARAQGSKLYRNDGRGKFVDVSAASGACPATLVRCRDLGVFDYDGDGLLDLLILQDLGTEPEDRPAGIRLFRNRGNLAFEEMTTPAGLAADLWGTGIAVADLNGDRRPDFFVAGVNRLFLSQPNTTYKEAESLRPLFDHPVKGLDWVTGAAFGDLDRDGDLDLVLGRHPYEAPARLHLYLNLGLKNGIPQFREITNDLGLPTLPQKAPNPEIQDFDNDGIADLYWSAWFAEGEKRWPFICKGLGVRDGLPRFDVPKVPAFDLEMLKKNAPPEKSIGMVYYVNGPAVDYDGDGDLDFCCGIWPEEPSRFFRNDTKGGNWLEVRVEGTKMNRMGVGAQVRVFKAGERALLGFQEITLNGGYSGSRAAIAHFGLGTAATCDVEITLPSRVEPIIERGIRVNQTVKVREP
jgi:hypothetical protein